MVDIKSINRWAKWLIDRIECVTSIQQMEITPTKTHLIFVIEDGKRKKD